MELMYLTFQEDAPLYLGVKNKIEGQIAAFEKLGYEVTCSMWKENSFRFFGADSQSFPVSASGGKMRQFALIAQEYLRDHHFDVLYFRIDRVSSDVIRLCKTARSMGAKKVIVEVPNYPYLSDYMRNIRYAKGLKHRAVTAAKVLLTVADDRLAGLSLKKYADAAILYGNHADTFFGVKAMHGENGVSVDTILSVPHRSEAQRDIVILGVAGTLWWQGYDRILQGMSSYKQHKKPEAPSLKFHLVGGDAIEMPEFRELVSSLGLTEDVTFHGFLKGKELADIYKIADVGASSLGCYRRGLTHCNSLKAREYCAAALPFLYAYEDETLDHANAGFALKLSNDADPVSMDRVVDFVQHCRGDSSIAEKERRFAEESYDWKIIMKQILDFADSQKKMN